MKIKELFESESIDKARDKFQKTTADEKKLREKLYSALDWMNKDKVLFLKKVAGVESVKDVPKEKLQKVINAAEERYNQYMGYKKG